MPFRLTIVLDKNEILSPIVIQFVVALTTLLMVFRFVMDALRHRCRCNGFKVFLITLDSVTQAMVIYSLGIMQRPSGTNSYYQAWAVLLVTLRYSVKIDRPAGITLKQTPLVDLMSSFWAANILRSQAMKVLKVTGWLLWSVNSLRIIHSFLSSEFANDSHRESMRLLTEYMRHEHKEQGDGLDPSTMRGYRYFVLGEAEKLKMKKKKKEAGAKAKDGDVAEETENISRLLVALKEGDKEILTLEKIWSSDVDLGEDMKDLCKDLCLSFALYKLLRRRFFNFGIHEAKLKKTRRLVVEGILGKNPNSERAFRVSEAEVSFLNDFFNSRHAIIFAKGFPFIRLILSTILIGGIAAMAYAVHVFSKVAKEDELGAKVHHPVYFTWFLVSFLGVKEIWEIATTLSSDWTKILILCKYVEKPWWFRGSVAKLLVRILFKFSLWPRWHGKIGQRNLLFPTSFLLPSRSFTHLVDLSKEVKESVIKCLSRCLGSQQLENYLEEAFKQASERCLGSQQLLVSLQREVNTALRGVDGDVHILLVWHIATCYCELELAQTRGIKAGRLSCGKAFSRRKSPNSVSSDFLWSSYMTARTLSQYCAYVLTLRSPLVPGNSLMASFVLQRVHREKTHLFRIALDPCDSSTSMLTRLKAYASGTVHLYDNEEGNTILKKGADLGKTLTAALKTNEDNEALWKFLSEFWSGFVLYLAASTKASQHKIYLSSGGELMTHLWALLSHAGILGKVEHGDQSYDTAQTEGAVFDPNTQS